ncbi:MAG: Spy/CpxP family protein refolding chaperone [Aquabacterium sp.]|nr:Spy/CpxP family protein refolding chaperone [Aquabacterium sp.]
MKTWLKRTLIALASTGVLLGGLAACSHQRHHGSHAAMSEAELVQLKARFIQKASDKLDLDAAQQARLGVLADAVKDQRAALLAGTPNPRADLQALVAGPQFDRSRALALVEGKTGALRDKAPAVVTALADFYDSLKPEQQQKLRELMARGRGHGWGRG